MKSAALAIVLSACVPGFPQQEASVPQFEVASVKPAAPVTARYRGGTGPWTISTNPGVLVMTNVTLHTLIHYAYDLSDRQFSGEPGWIASETYDVRGKASYPATREELYLMLRKLLADRFQLRFHWETQSMWIYSLVVSKGGPKFHEATEATSTGSAGFSSMTMETFAKMISGSAATEFTQPLDRTGLKGKYDLAAINVRQAPTEAQVGMSLIDAWVEAMPRQLGLELKREKAPVRIFVIDHVGRVPSAN
jgi:uncharacterized protein (TIGR03435 family)